MNDSIFTKIINGDIPSYKIYEDDRVFAFLDIHPATDGHILVVPKTQIEFIWDLAEADYLALMTAVQKIGQRLRQVLEVPNVGILTIGVDVPHTHIHLIPFHDSAEMRRAFTANQDQEPDHDSLANMAKLIRF